MKTVSVDINKLTKPQLLEKIKLLEEALEKANREKELVERDYRTYKALKSGMIGVGAVRNNKA
jgi:hypothetical protein